MMDSPSKSGAFFFAVMLFVGCAQPSGPEADGSDGSAGSAGSAPSARSAGAIEVGAMSPAEALIDKSIAYHDPEGAWYGRAHRVDFAETRPNGPVRMTSLRLDPVGKTFGLKQDRQGQMVEGYVDGDICAATVDGQAPDSTQTQRWRLSCPDGLLWWRDYYAYVHGLPMKLVDDGGQVDPAILDTTFMDESVSRVKVTYDPEVGSDIWYFYFQPESAELVGARFYHDEEAGDGEYLIFDGQVDAGGMRLIEAVRWYTNTGDRFLGTDSLMAYAMD